MASDLLITLVWLDPVVIQKSNLTFLHMPSESLLVFSRALPDEWYILYMLILCDIKVTIYFTLASRGRCIKNTYVIKNTCVPCHTI